MIRQLLLLSVLCTTTLASCSRDTRTTITVQRFFGACEAEYKSVTDISAAEGECGIMTATINKFEADNPDIRVIENIVFWPGYDQLTAQLTANDIPDLVTMHGSVIADYQDRDLLTPMSDVLAAANIDTTELTDAALRAVTIEGGIWGMPMDTWAPLWHINMNLFEQAGLVKDGKPVLPSSPAELYKHAEQFGERTGLPYFVQGAANEYAGFTRNFYTLMIQQDAELFSTPRKTNFNTAEGINALDVFTTIFERDFTTKNQDYSAAVSGFMRGDGGVFLVGTWMVGTFDESSGKPDSALHNGYAVMPYPKLFEHNRVFADGHNWVMPKNNHRTPEQVAAVARFLEFTAQNNFDWSRTGHLPVFKSIVDSESWLALPHREALAEVTQTATPLSRDIYRQFPLETIVGQEASAAISGNKPKDKALTDMERRANALLESY